MTETWQLILHSPAPSLLLFARTLVRRANVRLQASLLLQHREVRVFRANVPLRSVAVHEEMLADCYRRTPRWRITGGASKRKAGEVLAEEKSSKWGNEWAESDAAKKSRLG